MFEKTKVVLFFFHSRKWILALKVAACVTTTTYTYPVNVGDFFFTTILSQIFNDDRIHSSTLTHYRSNQIIRTGFSDSSGSLHSVITERVLIIVWMYKHHFLHPYSTIHNMIIHNFISIHILHEPLYSCLLFYFHLFISFN